MSKSIMTKILPSTDTKPYRIKAYDGDNNSIVISTDSIPHSRADRRTHLIAVNKLKQKMGWKGSGVLGWMKGTEYVYVFNKQ
jgi:hypothetical protein